MKTGVWYWMNGFGPGGYGANSHEAILASDGAGGFGATIYHINGGIECNHGCVAGSQVRRPRTEVQGDLRLLRRHLWQQPDLLKETGRPPSMATGMSHSFLLARPRRCPGNGRVPLAGRVSRPILLSASDARPWCCARVRSLARTLR